MLVEEAVVMNVNETEENATDNETNSTNSKIMYL